MLFLLAHMGERLACFLPDHGVTTAPVTRCRFHQTAIEAARIQLLSIYKETLELIESGAPAAACGDAVRRTKAHANYIVKQIAKAAVVFAWEASGSAGMRNPNRLQRCFRDLYIGAGHQVFDDRGYCEFAKPALGLEAAPF